MLLNRTMSTVDEAKIAGLETELADLKRVVADLNKERTSCSLEERIALDGNLGGLNARIASTQTELTRLCGQQSAYEGEPLHLPLVVCFGLPNFSCPP